jgi:hypothetical protein
LARDLYEEVLPAVFLKQFRSIEDGEGACLQQIVAARYKIERFRALPLLHHHELTIHPLDSQPVGEELGLQSQRATLAYRAEIDFQVGGGKVIWDSRG